MRRVGCAPNSEASLRPYRASMPVLPFIGVSPTGFMLDPFGNTAVQHCMPRILSNCETAALADGASRPPVALRIILFLLIYGALHWAYQLLRSTAFNPWLIHQLTVLPAAAAIDWLWPSDFVGAAGEWISWPGGRLALRAGCDGFEVMSLFVAAMLVADASWRRGMLALTTGCLAVWALNQARIVALYWSFRYQREWFDAIHTVWGPLFLITAVAAMYAWAVRAYPFATVARTDPVDELKTES